MRKYIIGLIIIVAVLASFLIIVRYFVPPTTDTQKLAGHYEWIGIVDWNRDGVMSLKSVASGDDIVIALHPHHPLAKDYYEKKVDLDDNRDGVISNEDVLFSQLRILSFKSGNVLMILPLDMLGIYALRFDNPTHETGKVSVTGGEELPMKDDMLSR